MNIVEEKLKDIPSTVDENKILRIVHSTQDENYFSILKSISASDDKEISNWLNISEKTFRSHKTTNKLTKRNLIEHTIMLISLFKHGIEIFGSEDNFKQWLRAENFSFGKKAPIGYMDTAGGIKFIDDRLTGIEYGDNA